MIKRAIHLALSLVFVLGCNQKANSDAKPAGDTTPNGAAATGAPDQLLTLADTARIQGSPTAKLWLLESSDFECPYCKQFHDETWPQLQKEYIATGKVRFAFVNHPMPMHQFAIPAAEAAMCAAQQNKFWPMHDALYATQGNWAKRPTPLTVFDSLASTLNIDMTAWRSCVSTHHTRPLIESDLARSKKGGVNGTPSFFIGDHMAMEGAQPFKEFKKVLDSALAKAGSK